MKKKVLLIAAIAAGVFTTSSLQAQDFKPAGGEKNIEVNFAPLGGNPISINNLKFRYFMDSQTALRVGFSVSSSSTTDIQLQGPNQIEVEGTNSSFGFSINPGIEKHFEGTDRLSPYVGAELNFASSSTTQTQESLNGAGDAIAGESEVKDGSTTLGLNLLLGADWYFSKHIYMGTEVGFGFATTSNADTESTPVTGPKVSTPNGSSSNFGPNFNSRIRLGFLF
tara:strand:+ start:12891 stop:13562 length:672 start_codon:yes stop_codon:yes gene_type:complete